MVLELKFFLNIVGEDFQRSKELKNAKKIDFFKILKCTCTLKIMTLFQLVQFQFNTYKLLQNGYDILVFKVFSFL